MMIILVQTQQKEEYQMVQILINSFSFVHGVLLISSCLFLSPFSPESIISPNPSQP